MIFHKFTRHDNRRKVALGATRTDVVRVRRYANTGSSVTIHPFAPEQYKTLVHGQDRSGGWGPAPESRRKEST